MSIPEGMIAKNLSTKPCLAYLFSLASFVTNTNPNKWRLNMKLNIKSFALTCGVLWGLGLFFLTWWFIAFDGATGEPTLIGKLYRGYTVSPIGSVVGLVYAFFDALIGGAIFAWLYNKLAGCAEDKKASQP
jgi:hypothetical protein